MLKKTLAVFVAAAMLLPGSLVKAKPDPNPPDPPCSFHLATRDGRDTSFGYVSVSVVWDYRIPGVSSREVKPRSVTIYNYSGRSIKLVTDRWENSSGIVQRGIAGEIPYLSNRTWYPTTWFPTTQNPYVGVSAAATTRPGLGGSTRCRNY